MPRALFIGRFQPFHNAHLADIKKILEECDEILIAIGSSREKDTLENPFSYSERKAMIEAALKEANIKKYRIFPVPDLYDDRKWMGYIKKNLPKFDVVYSGNRWTLECFKRHNSEIKKIRLVKGLSSTVIREKIIRGLNWRHLVPKKVADLIEKINGVQKIKRISRTSP